VKVLHASGLHPTAQKLVDVVIEMMDENPYNTLKSEIVLERCGLSRGPLYHHFVDFQDLVETAQIQIYQEYATGISQALGNLIASCTESEQLKIGFASFVNQAVNDATVKSRLQLIEIVHNAQAVAGFRKKFLPVQEQINLSWIEMYRFCLDLGWADPTVEPRAFALLMQSTVFGRIMNNISHDKLDLNMLMEFIPTLFNKFCLANCSGF